MIISILARKLLTVVIVPPVEVVVVTRQLFISPLVERSMAKIKLKPGRHYSGINTLK